MEFFVHCAWGRGDFPWKNKLHVGHSGTVLTVGNSGTGAPFCTALVPLF